MHNEDRHPADAKVNLEVEEFVRKKFNPKLIKKKLKIDKKTFIEIDGYLEKPRTFVEIWARIGAPKSAQKQKIDSDILKILFAEKVFGSAEKVLLFVDEAAMQPFSKKSKRWIAKAIQHFGFQLKLVEIPPKLRNKIKKSQKDSALGNSPRKKI